MQVEDCELSKEFIDLHIQVGDRALVRQFIKEGQRWARHSVQNWVAEYVNLLQGEVWLDLRMR